MKQFKLKKKHVEKTDKDLVLKTPLEKTDSAVDGILNTIFKDFGFVLRGKSNNKWIKKTKKAKSKNIYVESLGTTKDKHVLWFKSYDFDTLRHLKVLGFNVRKAPKKNNNEGILLTIPTSGEGLAEFEAILIGFFEKIYVYRNEKKRVAKLPSLNDGCTKDKATGCFKCPFYCHTKNYKEFPYANSEASLKKYPDHVIKNRRNMGDTNGEKIKVIFAVDFIRKDKPIKEQRFYKGIRKYCKRAGIDRKSVYITSVVKCLPPAKKSTVIQAMACTPYFVEEITKYPDALIVPLGATALKVITNMHKSSILSWEGSPTVIELAGVPRLIFPMFSYEYVHDVNDHLLSHYSRRFKELKKIIKKGFKPKKTNYQMLTKIDDIEKFLKDIVKEDKPIVYDVETNTLKSPDKDARITLFSVSNTPYTGTAIPIQHTDHKWSAKDYKRLLKAIRVFMDRPLIGHNVRFDNNMCRRLLGVKLRVPLADTMLMHWCVDDTKPHSLKDLAIEYTDMGDYSKPMDDALSDYGDDWGKVPLNILGKYGSMDADATIRLYYELKKVLDIDAKADRRLTWVHETFYNHASDYITKMEYAGACLDVKYNKKLIKKYTKESDLLLKEIKRHPLIHRYITKKTKNDPKRNSAKPWTFNLNSNPQMSEIFFKVFKFKAVAETDAGNPSTDKGSLFHFTKLGKKGSRPAQLIRSWGYRSKLLSTYTKPLRKSAKGYADAFKERVFGRFNLSVTRTGRLCIAKGQLIDTVRDVSKYPKGVPIEDVKVGDLVYTYDDDLNLTIKPVTKAWFTKRAKVCRVHWQGDGHKHSGYLDCTRDHPIRLVDGSYVEAQNLKDGDRVLAMSRGVGGYGYSRMWATGHEEISREHRFIYETLTGEDISDYVIHHKDHNKLNNLPDNLEKKTRSEHTRDHTVEYYSDPANVKAMAEKVSLSHRDGSRSYDNLKRGVYNHMFLNLDRDWMIQVLEDNGGKPTVFRDVYNYDYETIQKYMRQLGIDWKAIRRKFNKRGARFTQEMVDEGRLIHESSGQVGAMKFMGCNFYRWQELQQEFGYEKAYNHRITKVDFLDEETDFYDLTVEDTNNFIASELCCHNSSSAPNLQNIGDPHIKRQYISRFKGGHLTYGDFSQVELRGMAVISGDKSMMDVYRAGEDLHMKTACAITGLTLAKYISKSKDFQKKFRTVAKRINFGIAYGIGASGIVNLLEDEGVIITKDEAREYIEKFYKAYPRVKSWMEEVRNFVRKNKYAVSAFGKRRHLAKIDSKDEYTRSQVDRQAVNHVVQSTASDFGVLSGVCLMREIEKRGLKSRLFITVHDSLGIDTHPDEGKIIAKLMRTIMEDVPKYSVKWGLMDASQWDWYADSGVPMDVDLEVGYNWRDLVEIKKLKEIKKALKKSKKTQKEKDATARIYDLDEIRQDYFIGMSMDKCPLTKEDLTKVTF